jgi:hypothetical protein
MIALTIAFYLVVVFCFILELNSLAHPVKEHVITIKTREELEAKTDFRNMSKDVQTHYLNQVVYWFTCMSGVLSSQWPAFLTIVLIAFVSKFYRHVIWAKWVDTLVCGALLLFAILNRFHLHLDLGGWIIAHIGL